MQDRLSHARRLLDLGCPLDLRYFPRVGLRVEQVGGVIESQVFEIESFGIGCILNLEIVNYGGRPIYLRDFEIELPWMESRFCLLPDARDSGEASGCYRFAGTKIEFPRNIVINRFVPGSTRLARGGLVAGLLLSQSPEPFPECYKHGQTPKAKFSIVDQFRDRHSESVTLYVDRSAQFSPKQPKKPHRRLFEVSPAEGEKRLTGVAG